MEKELFNNLIESIKMDAYIENKLSDMHVCAFCGRIGYKELPMKKIGEKWICIDCLRELKESIDNLDNWEQEIMLQKELKRDIRNGLNQ